MDLRHGDSGISQGERRGSFALRIHRRRIWPDEPARHPPSGRDSMRSNNRLPMHRNNEAVTISGPWTHILRDGRRIQVEVASHGILFEGRQARFSLVQDVTERQQLHHQLLHQAHHDMLTGLPNRLLLLDRMEQALASAARRGRKVAIHLHRSRPLQADQRHLRPQYRRRLPEAGRRSSAEAVCAPSIPSRAPAAKSSPS